MDRSPVGTGVRCRVYSCYLLSPARESASAGPCGPACFIHSNAPGAEHMQLRTVDPTPRATRGTVMIGLLVAAVVVVAATRPAVAEEVRIRFQPVDGDVWTREMENVMIQELADLAPRREQTTLSTVKYTYQQEDDGAWTVLQEPLAASMLIDGAPIENEVLDQTVGVQLEVQLDANGRATSVDGFGRLIRKLEDNLDRATYTRVQQQLSAESMESGELQTWNRLRTEFLGATVDVGDRWHVEDEIYVTGPGWIDVVGTISFDGWTELDGRRALKIVYEYDEAGRAVAALGRTEFDHKLVLRRSDQANQQHNTVLNGTVTWVIDPETGYLLFEKKDQVHELPLDPTGEKKGMVENRYVYRFRPVDAD